MDPADAAGADLLLDGLDARGDLVGGLDVVHLDVDDADAEGDLFVDALEGVEILTPCKKPRGGALTPAQKAYNRQLAALRIRIEHVLSSVKRCRIIKEICRLRLVGARDAVMEIACSLHNFRITLFPWTPLL